MPSHREILAQVVAEHASELAVTPELPQQPQQLTRAERDEIILRCTREGMTLAQTAKEAQCAHSTVGIIRKKQRSSC